MKIGELGEDALIALFARDGGDDPGLVVGNGDDAAAFSFGDEVAVLTTDTLVEGVHFLAPGMETGRKLVAVNLSDLAAMGARPRLLFVSVCLPAATPVEVAAAIADGIRAQAKAHGAAIAGGNVTRIDGPMVLGLTAVGSARAERLLRRGSAPVGAGIFVTGTLGDARAGLEVAEGPLRQAQLDPAPRVAAGLALAASGAVLAMCDVSDGLARDLRNVARGARIDAAKLPISPALAAFAGPRAVEYAAVGGEDYELLFAAFDEAAVARVAAATGTPITRIGEVLAEGRVLVVDGVARPLAGGFDHFGEQR